MAPLNTDNAPSVVAAPPPSTDSPRRCFICLTDQEPSDPPSSWVDPCPCTLEAHQDCMLSWVTDCERSNKPLVCPVCKSPISLEGPWDPVVAVTDAVAKKFTSTSPFILLSGMAMGIQFSMQMYGAAALWAFAGRDSLYDFMLGPEDHMRNTRIVRLASERLGNALVLMNVGPVLLMSQLTPWLATKIFLPTASLYGVYHVMHDEHFLSWPPSPQLAMAVFPYVRTVYFNFWREFVFPHEVNLNRRIMGLPPLENRPADARAADLPARPRRENNDQAFGFVGFLNNLIDALDPDVEDDEVAEGEEPLAQLRIGAGEGDEAEGGIVLDIVIEEVDEEGNPNANNEQQGGGGRDQPAAEPRQDPANAPANPPGQNNQHEAPQAPPARRPGIGTILSGVSNAIVSSLILPGISFAVGELLRLALPKSWTTRSGSPWGSPRPGLLQQQWGRSLVGGCLWIVMKDFVRLYTKYRKVSAMGKRRVKNVNRNRRSG